jgi:hypothetical protein
VTEKYFNALRAGYVFLDCGTLYATRACAKIYGMERVLPIVDGPPGGYRGYAPTNHSVIELDNFP